MQGARRVKAQLPKFASFHLPGPVRFILVLPSMRYAMRIMHIAHKKMEIIHSAWLAAGRPPVQWRNATMAMFAIYACADGCKDHRKRWLLSLSGKNTAWEWDSILMSLWPLTLVPIQSRLIIGIAIMSFSHFAFQYMRFTDFVLSLYGACAVWNKGSRKEYGVSSDPTNGTVGCFKVSPN